MYSNSCSGFSYKLFLCCDDTKKYWIFIKIHDILYFNFSWFFWHTLDIHVPTSAIHKSFINSSFWLSFGTTKSQRLQIFIGLRFMRQHSLLVCFPVPFTFDNGCEKQKYIRKINKHFARFGYDDSWVNWSVSKQGEKFEWRVMSVMKCYERVIWQFGSQ